MDIKSFSKNLRKINELHRTAGDGFISDVRDYIDTGSYLFNAQLGRSIYHGIADNRILMFGGLPSSGKTYLTLSIVGNFLEKNPENQVVYFDTESAIETSQVLSMNIDVSRFHHMPVKSLEEFKEQIAKILNDVRDSRKADLKSGAKDSIMFVLDSLGMAPSQKEVEDAISGKNAADMGLRGKLIRSIFRTITLELGVLHYPMIVTTHTYESMSPYAANGMGGGKGPQYSSSTTVELAVKKDYDKDKKVQGVLLTSKLRKSRLTMQDSVVPLSINFRKGLNRYHGLLEFCVDHKLITREGNKYFFKGEENGLMRHAIEKDPAGYFTKERLDIIDAVAKRAFQYGGDVVTDDEIDANNEVDENQNLSDLNSELDELINP